MKQGFPLRPLLFNVLIIDLKKEMGLIKLGGVRLWNERMHTLAYADDMVLIAKKENEMRSMIDRLKKYFERKRLKLNVEKSKILRFKKKMGVD